MLVSRHSKSKNVHYKRLIDAGFTQNEIDNVQKTVKNKIDLLHKLSSVPCSNLITLRENGFSLEQLIKVLGNVGGLKSIEALHHLFDPISLEIGPFLVDELNQPITPFFQLQQAGFTKAELIKVLEHSGGSNNLTALRNLLQPMFYDAFNQPITPLFQLRQAGFTVEVLIRVLSHDGGSNNLAAMQQLLHPIFHKSGQPLVNEHNQLVTHLSLLQQAGFTTGQLIRVLSNQGGSKNLAVLLNLLQPVFYEGQLFVDESNQPVTLLSQWLQAGFTVVQLIRVLSHDGGSNNLIALQKLFEPIFYENELLLDNLNQPITTLSQLLQAGFTTEQLIKVLAHNGGSNNLATLQQLLHPIFHNGDPLFVNEFNQPISSLSQLLQAGFTTEQLIKVLGHDGGSNNLIALQSLLHPIFLESEQLLLDELKEPTTPLCQLLKEGFTTEQLIKVLAHDGGFKNLSALRELLKSNEDESDLYLLLQAGFTIEQLIKVLRRNGGYKNLLALQDLLRLRPVESNQSISKLSQLLQQGFTIEQLIKVLANNGGVSNLAVLLHILQPTPLESIDALNQPIIPFSQLLQAGFTIEQLINVLGNCGGTYNLAALQQFVGHPFLTYPNACDIMSNLGSGNSKSAHLKWLHSLLSSSEYAQYITESQCLENLCNAIRLMKASELGKIAIASIESLQCFISSASRKRSREYESTEEGAKVPRYSLFYNERDESSVEASSSTDLCSPVV